MTTISFFNRCGSGSERCKDVTYIRENGEGGFYSLADGVNSSQYSDEGARKVLGALADEWEKNPNSFFNKNINEIKNRMIEIINEVIYNLSVESGKRDAFQSTLLIVVLSKGHSHYRWLHIGDGLILKENHWGGLDFVSYEQNGINSCYTFTTTSTPLKRYLRVGEGSVDLVKRLILMTDGAAAPFYQNRTISEEGKRLLNEETECICSILDQMKLIDDYSMLNIVL